MKKILKVALKVILWTLAVVFVLLLLLPLWVGPVVTGVANSIVPDKVGTDFRLGEFCLNPYVGSVHVGDMQLANPAGFTRGNCVELGDLNVKIDMSSVLSKKIRIENVELNGLYVVIEKNGKNFKALAPADAQGEASADVTIDAAKDDGVKEEPVAEDAVSAEESSEEGPRVQIDRLVLKNVRVKYGMILVPIPTIVLTNIGADDPEGMVWEDVWLQVSAAVMKSLGAIGDLGKELFKSGKDAATQTIDATAIAATNVTAQALQVTTDAAEKTANAAVKAIEATLGTATGATEATLDAAADAAEKTFKSFKDVFKKAKKD